MKKILGSLFDLLWVFQAYLRGKVLRQKAYRLQANDRGLIRSPMGTSVKRMTMLKRWWGLRPVTLEELLAPAAQYEAVPIPQPRVPYLGWDGDEWCLGQEWDKDLRFRFRTIRK